MNNIPQNKTKHVSKGGLLWRGKALYVKSTYHYFLFHLSIISETPFVKIIQSGYHLFRIYICIITHPSVKIMWREIVEINYMKEYNCCSSYTVLSISLTEINKQCILFFMHLIIFWDNAIFLSASIFIFRTTDTGAFCFNLLRCTIKNFLMWSCCMNVWCYHCLEESSFYLLWEFKQIKFINCLSHSYIIHSCLLYHYSQSCLVT